MAVKIIRNNNNISLTPGNGKVVIGGGTSSVMPIYNGDYEITPKKEEEQILKTSGYAMAKDVVVKEIPYYEIKNDDGGLTATIGKEVIISG